jgi:hypothetical protein
MSPPTCIFIESAAQVDQYKKRYHPRSIQTKNVTTGLFGGKQSWSGAQEDVN